MKGGSITARFGVTEEQISHEIWSLGSLIENPFKPDHFDDNSSVNFNARLSEVNSLESAGSQPRKL